jgi:predicted dehydrogenase
MSAGSSAEGKVYRVACIGAARMGSWFDDIQRERAQRDGGHSLEWVPGAVASVCQAIPRVELVAVCDLVPELVQRLRERWDIPAGYTDYREMIERERPDIVAIVTSWGSSHGEIAGAVAETGLVRGIYCEKPIGASMAQARRIVAACRERGVLYSCAHVFRWNARYQLAQRWIAEGAIGEVRAVTCSAMGTLLHSGTHQVDAMLGLAGDPEPEWAMGVVETPVGVAQGDWPVPDPPGGGYVRLRNGVDLLMDGRSPGPRVFQVSGTAGKVVLWNDVRQAQLWQAVPGAGRPDLAPGALETPAQPRSYAVTQMEELVAALDGQGRPACDEVRAARALEVVLGLHLSHQRNGERVPFPLGEPQLAVDTR